MLFVRTLCFDLMLFVDFMGFVRYFRFEFVFVDGLCWLTLTVLVICGVLVCFDCCLNVACVVDILVFT